MKIPLAKKAQSKVAPGSAIEMGAWFKIDMACGPVKYVYATADWGMYPYFFNAFIQRGALRWTIKAS